jgi:hypothetical protein
MSTQTPLVRTARRARSQARGFRDTQLNAESKQSVRWGSAPAGVLEGKGWRVSPARPVTGPPITFSRMIMATRPTVWYRRADIASQVISETYFTTQCPVRALQRRTQSTYIGVALCESVLLECISHCTAARKHRMTSSCLKRWIQMRWMT